LCRILTLAGTADPENEQDLEELETLVTRSCDAYQAHNHGESAFFAEYLKQKVKIIVYIRIARLYWRSLSGS
jgi:hypothetical protein